MNLYDRNTVTPVRATTTTGADGWWTISHATQGRFDVEVVNGTSKRRRKYDTREQLEYLEVANFRIRNPADTFEYDIVPSAITAARQLNLPLITATDTLMVLGLNQTVTGVLTLTTPAIGDATGTSLVLTGNLSAEDLLIEDSDASHYLTITTTSNLTAARTLTIVPGDASRIVTITADATIGGSTSGTNTGDVTLAGTPDYITIANQVITRAKLDPADDLNTFASSVLAALVTDETGSGALVFGTAPTIAGGTHTALTGLGIRSTGTGAFDLTLANAENLTAGRTLTIQLGDAARTLILGASPSLSGTNTGDQTITLTGEVTGSGTGSFAATVAATHSGSAHHAQQSLFETIAVSGQTSVVADSATDTLTLVAGTNITITTDATTDAITITAAGASGANTALSNLAAVAINLPLLPDAAAADDFGSATLPFKDIFLAGSSGTPGTNNFRITGASTSGTRVITLPDATGTLLYSGGALGTPASGTGTNITGIPAASILAGSFGAGAYVISTSLQAATIELGAATDTTLSRTGAGDIAIEGNAVYRASGTDVPVADGGTGLSATTVYAVLCGGTTTTGALQSIASVGTSGQVLTSNGAGALPTFQAAAGGATPAITIATIFETAARFTETLVGSGASDFNFDGMRLTTGTTNPSSVLRNLTLHGSLGTFDSNSNFSCWWKYGVVEGATRQSACHVGVVTVAGSGITFTPNHYGFKSIRAASVTTVSATNANGTAETATSFTAPGADIYALWHAKKTGTTDVTFYTGRTLRATHTTNLPSGDIGNIGQFAMSNANTGADSTDRYMGFSYNQDAE